jgi:hypothetical protein
MVGGREGLGSEPIRNVDLHRRVYTTPEPRETASSKVIVKFMGRKRDLLFVYRCDGRFYIAYETSQLGSNFYGMLLMEMKTRL